MVGEAKDRTVGLGDERLALVLRVHEPAPRTRDDVLGLRERVELAVRPEVRPPLLLVGGRQWADDGRDVAWGGRAKGDGRRARQ